MRLATPARNRCAAAYVNDAFGPNRDAATKAKFKKRKNVKFVVLKDGSGFPHVFWKCISPIPAGGTLWGDYGDDYWGEFEQAEVSEPMHSAMMRRLLFMLRGCSAACPLKVECE